MKKFESNPTPDPEPCALGLLTEIALLKESGTDADNKQAAKLFAGLLTHYEPFLRKLAYIHGPFDGSTNLLDPEDLYAELVVKIWEKADQFSPKEQTQQTIKRQFIGWTSSILKNHVSDLVGSLGLAITSTDSIEALEWDPIQEKVPDPSERAKLVAEILAEMDPDDADVLRWAALANPLDGTQPRTDAEDRAALCHKLNVTEAGLRKRKQRAMKAFREEFEARSSEMA